MIRKLRRSVARTAMKDEGIKLFGNYATVKGKVKNRRGNDVDDEVMKSVFARKWRQYA